MTHVMYYDNLAIVHITIDAIKMYCNNKRKSRKPSLELPTLIRFCKKNNVATCRYYTYNNIYRVVLHAIHARFPGLAAIFRAVA